jgi:hypothetical protein
VRLHLGDGNDEAGRPEIDRRIVLECLDHLVHARASGEIRTLPLTWAEARRERIEIERGLGLRT